MTTSFTFLMVLAGVAFVMILASALVQWIRADLAVVQTERRLQSAGAQAVAMPAPHDWTGGHAETVPAPTEHAVESSDTHAATLDDETGLARLSLGWGGGGMLLGLCAGGAIGGAVGALVGAVALSTVGVLGVVVFLAVSDHAAAHATEGQRTR